MPGFDQSSSSPEAPSPADDAALAEALKIVPRGAFALAGTALGLLILAWLFVYFFIFLARGAVS